MFTATVTEQKMEQKYSRDLQDFYLGIAIKDKIPVTIYFVSGAKVTGTIGSFDKYSVILDSPDRQLLIFKHAISLIRPG
jgi:host factor-I protein